VTGTTAITSFGTVANSRKLVRFTAALTLTHNATSLILPGAADITTAAGDIFEFASDGSGNWRCIGVQLASGKAVVAPDTSTLEDQVTGQKNAVRPVAILEDQKASGTSGGASVLGTQTRDLNTIVHRDDDNILLSNNKFTLPAGKYYLKWQAPSAYSTYVRSELFNVTDGVNVAWSINQNSTSGTGAWSSVMTEGEAVLEITEAKEFSIRQYNSGTYGEGLGFAWSGAGDHETYTRVVIFKGA
jgi:hypothetical protein